MKKQVVKVESRSEFPNIVSAAKSMFYHLRRTRPQIAPDCYLSKKWVVSENVFDFGPLLINKHLLNRHEPAVKNINSECFKIVNAGKFDCECEFSWASDVL